MASLHWRVCGWAGIYRSSGTTPFWRSVLISMQPVRLAISLAIFQWTGRFSPIRESIEEQSLVLEQVRSRRAVWCGHDQCVVQPHHSSLYRAIWDTESSSLLISRNHPSASVSISYLITYISRFVCTRYDCGTIDSTPNIVHWSHIIYSSILLGIKHTRY